MFVRNEEKNIDFLIGRATYNIFLIKSFVLQKYQIPLAKLTALIRHYRFFSLFLYTFDSMNGQHVTQKLRFYFRKMDVTQLKCENLAKSIWFESIRTQYVLVIGAWSPISHSLSASLYLSVYVLVEIKC